jgi:hypothetical protein
LIGTHGIPFTGSADKIFEASTKRKRGVGVKKSPENDDDETEDEEPIGCKKIKKASKKGDEGKRVGKGNGEDGMKVKEEQESGFESDESSFEDSEDEMPLAKLRKARLGPFQFSSSSKPYTSPYPSRMISPGAGGIEVPRSMAGFEQGGVGRMMGGGPGQGLGSEFQSPVGFNPHFVLGNSGVGGWGAVDWARWQSRFGGRERVKGSLCR